jgi:hypothetical protein
MGIVTLILSIEHPSAYFQPNTLLQWISSMQQLETLQISFSFPVPSRDVERQPMPPPITTPVTLPNLRWFLFQGVSSYMEAVVRWIVTPRLEKLDIEFFKQLTFSVPFLLQFMKIENLRFDRADIEFANYGVYMRVYPEGALMHSLSINVRCWHLDWQVSSVAQISNSLSQIFSTMEHLTVELPTLGPILGYEVQSLSSEEHNEVDPNEWGKLLRSFNNVKALRINDRIAKELSRCLQPDDGESLLELLPKLEPGGLIYSGGTNDPDALKSFGNIFRALRARQPVTPVRPSPSFVNPVPRGSGPGLPHPSRQGAAWQGVTPT